MLPSNTSESIAGVFCTLTMLYGCGMIRRNIILYLVMRKETQQDLDSCL